MRISASQLSRSLLVALAVAIGTESATAQQCTEVRANRVGVLGGVFALSQVSIIAIRHNTWWTTPSAPFHFAGSDQDPAKGQNRLLHTAVTYQLSWAAQKAWMWSCMDPTAAAWVGAATAMAYSLPKEIGDALHENHGFSIADFIYGAAGASLAAIHSTTPGSRAFNIKVFYWPSREFRNSGPALPDLESDYAGHRYYLTFSPGRLSDEAGLPRWLGVAIGHSVPYWITIPPIHEWYFTLDVNLADLPIQGRGWHRFAKIADQLHVPLPGLKISDGRLRFGLY